MGAGAERAVGALLTRSITRSRSLSRQHSVRPAGSVLYSVFMVSVLDVWEISSPRSLSNIMAWLVADREKGWRCPVCVIPIQIRRLERGKQIVGTLGAIPGWKSTIAAARATRP